MGQREGTYSACVFRPVMMWQHHFLVNTTKLRDTDRKKKDIGEFKISKS